MRQQALEQLSRFAPYAGKTYEKKRNFDFGPQQTAAVSQLSPFLRYRIITEPEVIATVAQQHSYESCEKFVQEVCWRTYWKGWLEQRPYVWDDYLDQVNRPLDDDTSRCLHQVKEGKTGIGAFDQWTKELLRTGYLHNHVRMWYASIWIFTLKLPWYRGADFFLHHLLDGDPASNTLSWRWVAGLHTKGKHYLATAENIQKFTDGRFYPTGLVAEAEPLVEERATTEKLPLQVLPDMPTADFDTLVVWPDDLQAIATPTGHKAKKVLFVNPDWEWTGGCDRVKKHRRDCFVDAMSRCRANGKTIDQICSTEDFLQKTAGQTLVWYQPMIGFGRHKADGILAQMKNRVIPLRRLYDARLFPHATKGYFHLKKQLPKLFHSIQNSELS